MNANNAKLSTSSIDILIFLNSLNKELRPSLNLNPSFIPGHTCNIVFSKMVGDTGFVKDNPNLNDMINGNRLDVYILYFLVYEIIKILNNLNDR